MRDVRLGLMLYTVRDECARDFPGTLRDVAALGFEGVELFDLHDCAPSEVAGVLDETGLVACARHAGLDAIEARLPELAAEARELGWRRLVVSWVDPGRLDETLVRRLEAAAGAATSHGLELGFHNHDAEVRPREDGRRFLDELLASATLFLELDLGWAWYAGVDPVALLGAARGRCPLVHVKDFRSREGRAFAPVGDGAVGRRGRSRVAAGRAGRDGRSLARGRPPLAGGASRDARGARVRAPARVGVLGCGVISRQYAENAKAFDAFELVACADLDDAQAQALSAAHGLPAVSVTELVADPSIEIVLNLTPPAVHATVIRDAFAAGKHVYTEKPLATETADAAALVEESDRLGLRLACAPDIFLGGPYQAARRLIDGGAIGDPLAVSAAMLVGGQETWHPNPDIFFADGAGPLLDMGPYYLSAIVALLGPVRRVAGFASTRTRERTIEIGPRTGQGFTVATPTHTAASMELESGVTANLVASFEATGQYICDLQIHGTEGVLALPDPNAFAGPLRLRRGREGWKEVPIAAPNGRDARGIGLHELVESIAAGRPPRASGRFGLHVVEVARGILRSAAEGRTVEIESRVDQPKAMPAASMA